MTKAELLEQAKSLGLDLTEDNTMAEIREAIANAKDANEKPEATKKDVEDKAEKATEKSEDFAKAGKRSKKSVTEAEAEAERQARKITHDTSAQGDVPANQVKGPAPKTRPLIERKGKAYRKAAELVDKTTIYPIDQAVELATKTSVTKFDSTVEIHVKLGVDPKQADQNIRSTVSLPHGTGKTVRVVAMVPDNDIDAAKKAGAIIAGSEAVLKMLDHEDLNFDVLVATPDQMAKLGKYARVLGPRGLMPNPKAGTVSANPVQAIKEAVAGKVEFRVDKQGVIHLGVGKVSFGASKLADNIAVFTKTLKALRPASLKGNYIVSATISTTMGPGIKVSLD